ncbi:ribulose-phosphate 3-epimerase [Candidatus Peregrinibacteria bacterium]|nr:ribulose-phosphate 3-epimerase [Candidatus Peregrinibacteria bacterium]
MINKLPLKIAPSILSADFGKLNEEIASVEPFSDLLHVDVMDGHFVPNITIGPPVVKMIKTKLPLDVHLMIENPERYIEDFVNAGAASITVHVEACNHLHRVIQQIKSLGVKAAVSVNPATPIEHVFEIVDDLDMVLIMSVNPGFGGQDFIPSVLPKVRRLREKKPTVDIQMDGGVSDKTVVKCVEAGANVLVSGSYIFKSDDREQAIKSLRNS